MIICSQVLWTKYWRPSLKLAETVFYHLQAHVWRKTGGLFASHVCLLQCMCVSVGVCVGEDGKAKQMRVWFSLRTHIKGMKRIVLLVSVYVRCYSGDITATLALFYRCNNLWLSSSGTSAPLFLSPFLFPAVREAKVRIWTLSFASSAFRHLENCRFPPNLISIERQPCCQSCAPLPPPLRHWLKLVLHPH